MRNSYCDHGNYDSINHPLESFCLINKQYICVFFLTYKSYQIKYTESLPGTSKPQHTKVYAINSRYPKDMIWDFIWPSHSTWKLISWTLIVFTLNRREKCRVVFELTDCTNNLLVKLISTFMPFLHLMYKSQSIK